MKIKFQLGSCLLPMVAVHMLVGGSPGVARAQTPAVAEKLNAANGLVRAGKYELAIEQYRALAAESADLAKLKYNSAVAHYRAGDIKTAETLFSETATAADDSIAAMSRYNRGNCRYAQALKVEKQQPRDAINLLENAISDYRSALSLAADNADARANIELANALVKKLKSLQPQNKQQPPQENQNSDSSPDQQPEGSDDAAQDQQNQASSDDSDQKKKNQESKQNSNSDTQKNASAANDPKPKQDSSQAQQQAAPATSQPDRSEQSDSPTADPQDSSQQNGDQENMADQASSAERQGSQQAQSKTSRVDQMNNTADRQDSVSVTSKGEDANDRSPQSEDDLTNKHADSAMVSTDQLKAVNENQPRDSDTGAVANAAEVEGGLMTKEEALKMLQAVRDRDMLRRLRQQQAERRRRIPVDRDW